VADPPDASDPPPEGAFRALAVQRMLLAGVVVVAAAVLFLSSERVPDPIERGSAAPGFELPRLGAEEPLSLESLRGRPVLVNFWATWCKPCEDEMPAMERLYRRLSDRGFELLAISVDEERAEVEAFRSRLAISFPILLDPAQAVSRRYQTTGFPESFLVDASGRVVERYVGPREWDHPDHVARIERLLEADAG